MNAILLEERYILEYIKNTLNDLKLGTFAVNDAKYHHNSDYRDAVSICKYGILTKLDLKKTGVRNYTDEFLQKMGDIESHVNGNDAVSLAVVGLQDLYPDEDEYDPFSPSQVDFLVSTDIMTFRTPTHYGNEFLSYNSIGVDKLRAIDIRLLKLIELIEKGSSIDDYSIKNLIEKYNCLKDLALTIKTLQLDIPLREMSYQGNSVINTNKLSTLPRLVLK